MREGQCLLGQRPVRDALRAYRSAGLAWGGYLHQDESADDDGSDYHDHYDNGRPSMTAAVIVRYLPTVMAACRAIKRKRDAKKRARADARLREYRELADLHDLEREQFRNMK